MILLSPEEEVINNLELPSEVLGLLSDRLEQGVRSSSQLQLTHGVSDVSNCNTWGQNENVRKHAVSCSTSATLGDFRTQNRTQGVFFSWTFPRSRQLQHEKYDGAHQVSLARVHQSRKKMERPEQRRRLLGERRLFGGGGRRRRRLGVGAAATARRGRKAATGGRLLATMTTEGGRASPPLSPSLPRRRSRRW